MLAVMSILRGVEQRFSLFDENSELSRLNTNKTLAVTQDFLDLFALSQKVHRATGGLFDPSVQTVWEAHASGTSAQKARAFVGFDQIEQTDDVLRLGPNQSLSFNGIAQGFATDIIRTELAARGYTDVLVNMGEFAAQGGPFKLGIQDPTFGQLGTVTLKNMCIATSSPSASKITGHDHIVHPKGGKTLWSTVSVEAKSAAIADACSTAFCMMPRADIALAKRHFALGRVLLVDSNGDLSTV
jgi:thiamine biosynthesis lipoprotein